MLSVPSGCARFVCILLCCRCVVRFPAFFLQHPTRGLVELLSSALQMVPRARAAEASRAFDCMLKRFISQQHIGNDFMVDWYIHPFSVVTRGDRRGNHLKVYRNGEKMKKKQSKAFSKFNNGPKITLIIINLFAEWIRLPGTLVVCRSGWCALFK